MSTWMYIILVFCNNNNNNNTVVTKSMNFISVEVGVTEVKAILHKKVNNKSLIRFENSTRKCNIDFEN